LGELDAIEEPRRAAKGRIKGDGGEKGSRILDGPRRAAGR
jgi:hypothetical protein